MGLTEDQIIEAEEGWQYGEDQQTRENLEGLTEEDPWNMMHCLLQLQLIKFPKRQRKHTQKEEIRLEEKIAKEKNNVNIEKGEMKKFLRIETKD